jgi:hypothetical protein
MAEPTGCWISNRSDRRLFPLVCAAEPTFRWWHIKGKIVILYFKRHRGMSGSRYNTEADSDDVHPISNLFRSFFPTVIVWRNSSQSAYATNATLTARNNISRIRWTLAVRHSTPPPHLYLPVYVCCFCMSCIQPRRYGILLRPTSSRFCFGAELLSDGSAASYWRDVRVVVCRRSRILGYRRAVSRVLLPAPLSPAQGERLRGDAKGSRESDGPSGGRFRQWSICWMAATGLGPAREAANVESCQGTLYFNKIKQANQTDGDHASFFWTTSRRFFSYFARGRVPNCAFIRFFS